MKEGVKKALKRNSHGRKICASVLSLNLTKDQYQCHPFPSLGSSKPAPWLMAALPRVDPGGDATGSISPRIGQRPPAGPPAAEGSPKDEARLAAALPVIHAAKDATMQQKTEMLIHAASEPMLIRRRRPMPRAFHFFQQPNESVLLHAMNFETENADKGPPAAIATQDPPTAHKGPPASRPASITPTAEVAALVSVAVGAEVAAEAAADVVVPEEVAEPTVAAGNVVAVVVDDGCVGGSGTAAEEMRGNGLSPATAATYHKMIQQDELSEHEPHHTSVLHSDASADQLSAARAREVRQTLEQELEVELGLESKMAQGIADATDRANAAQKRPVLGGIQQKKQNPQSPIRHQSKASPLKSRSAPIAASVSPAKEARVADPPKNRKLKSNDFYGGRKTSTSGEHKAGWERFKRRSNAALKKGTLTNEMEQSFNTDPWRLFKTFLELGENWDEFGAKETTLQSETRERDDGWALLTSDQSRDFFMDTTGPHARSIIARIEE